jgi:protein-S-isoprenylcysteine O-methyltransferase Ste14
VAPILVDHGLAETAVLPSPASLRASVGSGRLSPAAMDVLERWLVALFFGQVVLRLVYDAWTYNNPGALLLLPSEALTLILILVRRRTDRISLRWGDWLAAIVGTALPTLVISGTARAESTALLGLVFLTFMGLIVQVHAKLCLGRSAGMIAANRGVRESGPYQFVRHPMYAGYCLAEAAFLMANWTVWNAVVLATALVCQLIRIQAEERLLRQDPAYAAYAERVRWRLIPGLY